MRNCNYQLGPLAGGGHERKRTTDAVQPVANADHTEASFADSRREGRHVKADPIVLDGAPKSLEFVLKGDMHLSRLGMSRHVSECFLDDPVERGR